MSPRPTIGGDVVTARETVLRHSITLWLAERERDPSAEVALAFASRRLARAISASLGRQPRGWRDDNTAGEVVPARKAVLRRALMLDLAERSLGMDETSVPALMRSETALYFACKRLTAAIDADPVWQPPGWRDEDREASRL